MSMFCYQCQETVKGKGCTAVGVCGKSEQTSRLQDLLIYVLKGISVLAQNDPGGVSRKCGQFISKALFATITNANFDEDRIISFIKEGLSIKQELKNNADYSGDLLDSVNWHSEVIEDFYKKAVTIGVLSIENEDIRSLRELLIYGIKGSAAYAHHAAVLGYEDESIYNFFVEALASTTKELPIDGMVGLVMKAGDIAVKVMALLDKANTQNYGNPEISKVNIGVGKNSGILVSGHDLKDLEELLNQTQNTGIDVYTHSEMLPANYYPIFKKYKHLVGNYGNAWWKQQKEFESFNGPIIMTTNCIVPVKETYKNRIFTTGVAGFEGIEHIPERKAGQEKDFSQVINLAKQCKPPQEIETGEIIGGFAHHQVLSLADKIVEAVKSGAIKKFIVMAGCDGRQASRSYFTDVAKALPKDTVILTAGCAKYRYNKLDLGDINGIPRVLDAGQCNDSYSLAVVALKLKEVFGLEDINDLPISFDIGWYEQKAVTVLLALLSLGIKGIRLGPTLPEFLSPNVIKILVEKFDIKPIKTVQEDIASMIAVK